MKLEQRALRFASGLNALIGIVDVPERPLVRGLLVLADSRQYRTGSHRQFTLLARLLAGRGVAVMRFDRSGAGDSEGRESERSDGSDLAAAMKEFFIHVPEMKESVILAAGDATRAAALYASGDARVTGLALFNPELPPPESVSSSGNGAGASGGALRYIQRLAPKLLRRRLPALRGAAPPALPPELASAFDAYDGHILLVLGGADPAFERTARLLERRRAHCRRVEIAGADVGFSRSDWREAVAAASTSWLTSW
ncbi:hydrolase 1, exosortase A system-associated [Massilia brevitalea]|uniref:hydrolase 1, exosortase A system-associated n=1 Tax=Massilia brevitalea TaxID=442526 RepID=UPI0027399DD8|nr:hydrolase 1, exosortase A system-associated [Massilia brevitalea]